MRLPGLDAVDAAMIQVLPITLVFDEEARLRDVIASRLKKTREVLSAVVPANAGTQHAVTCNEAMCAPSP